MSDQKAELLRAADSLDVANRRQRDSLALVLTLVRQLAQSDNELGPLARYAVKEFDAATTSAQAENVAAQGLVAEAEACDSE